MGETSRTLSARIKEHKEAVRRFDTERNALAHHIATTNAKPLWDEVNILAKDGKWSHRRMKEAIWIDRQGSLNRNHGLEDITKYWNSMDQANQ